MLYRTDINRHRANKSCRNHEVLVQIRSDALTIKRAWGIPLAHLFLIPLMHLLVGLAKISRRSEGWRMKASCHRKEREVSSC